MAAQPGSEVRGGQKHSSTRLSSIWIRVNGRPVYRHRGPGGGTAPAAPCRPGSVRGGVVCATLAVAAVVLATRTVAQYIAMRQCIGRTFRLA